jgi:hypothetical protein
MNNHLRLFFVAVILMVILCSMLYGKEYKAAVKKLPNSDFYSSVVKSVVEATGNTVAIQVVPPARADYIIAGKEVDIQLPIVVGSNPDKQKELKYDFSTVVLAKLAWVIYTNTAKPIDIDSLRKGNPNKYRIEIDPSRSDDYSFATIASK